jgi:flagellar biosynthesis protein FlhF
MLTKTFRAANMLVALKNVQAELGPDALIISMREVPAGPIWAAWKKPGVEVIASKADKKANNEHKSESLSLPETKVENLTNQPSSEELKREIENLKLILNGQKLPTESIVATNPAKEVVPSEPKPELPSKEQEARFSKDDFATPFEDKQTLEVISEKMQKLVVKTKPVAVHSESPKSHLLHKNLALVSEQLSLQGVNKNLIEKIINTNFESLSPAALDDRPRLERFIKHQLEVCLTPVRKSLAFVPSRVMVLTGISGSGKTSTCAKLASFYTITLGKKVVWIEADTVRTSAIAEARTYTETLGIPLFLAYTPQELSELIASQSDADLILVDTTSVNPRVEDSLIELGSLLTVTPTGSTYLVVSSTTKEDDLNQVEKTLGQFGLKGAILTKTDETGTFGAAFDLLWLSKLPLFFVTSGIAIFGNLRPGNPEQLVNALFTGEFIVE